MNYDRIGKCECCGAEDVQVAEFEPPYVLQQKPARDLCFLCAASQTSSIDAIISVRTAEELMPRLEVMKTICFVGNQILKELKKLQEKS